MRRRLLVQAALVCALLMQPLSGRAQSPLPGTPAPPATVTGAAAASPTVTPDVGASREQPAASSYTVGQCASADRDTLRADVQNAALAVIGSTTRGLDIDALVDRKWRDLEMDSVVDTQVALAVQRLAASEGYWSRLLSGWSASKAEEFAEKISQDAFTAQPFVDAVNGLSAAIGDELARQVNAELAAAASTAFLCLRDYVGNTYSASLFSAFEESARASVAASNTLTVDPASLSIGIVDTHGGLITGAGIIVVAEVGSRVAAKISEKLAERMAGKVAGRVLGRAGSSLVPVAGWVVGIALIVWDLVEGGKGALPQIQDALTSEDVKLRIRSEVANAVRAGLPEEASITSLETAVGMIEEWDQFCVKYSSVCTLAEANASFRALLDTVPLSDLDRLQALEDVFLRNLGRASLDLALETGDFDTLLRLPREAESLLADTASVSMTLQWAETAGPDLPQVVAIGIHHFVTPDELTRDRLDRLLAWNDGVAVRKFLLLEPPARSTLWPLGGQTLLGIVSKLDEPELAQLAAGLELWSAADRQRIAGDFLAGARTLAEVGAGPTPVPSFTLQPTAGAGPTPDAAGATAINPGQSPSAQTGAPLPGTGATATTSASNGLFGRTDPATLGLLGAIVVLLTVVAALLLWRRNR